MYVLNITDDYDDFVNFTNNDIDDIIIIVESSLFTVPGIIILLSVIGLIIYTMDKFSKTNE